jgi:glycosyltransferase involved in cell wall biosynthesis
MESPLFSIIVPVYKAEKVLPECIESILSQTFSNFELLLINDGSPDKSGTLCEEYARKDRRICVFHKNNGGVSSARNFGIERAKGKWVAFVDSDDWLEVNFLEKMLNIAQKLNVNAVFCNCSYVFENEIKADNRFKENKIEDSVAVVKRILNKYEMRSELWGKIIQKKFLQTLKLKEHVAIGEDFLFLLELYHGYELKTAIITDHLYFYRQLKESAMSRNNIAAFNKILLKEYLQFVERNPDMAEKFKQENAVYITRIIISSLKKDLNQCKDPFVMTMLKENYNMAVTALQKNEKRLIQLLYIHPALAKLEQFVMKLIFERKNRT